MGCGASKNDVIKSASGSENEPKVKGGAPGAANGAANGNIRSSIDSIADQSNFSSRDSLNSSLISEGSTITASEKFGNGSATTPTHNNPATNNGNNNDIRGGDGGLIDSSNSSRNLPELPPLKPPRTSRVGFLDQSNAEEKMAEVGASKTMPIAFEVPAEEGDASLIKKHPPRRLRELEERPPEAAAITQEALEEKVAQANERRNQVLHQRVASARTKSARGGRIRRPLMDSELEASETMESGLERQVEGE